MNTMSTAAVASVGARATAASSPPNTRASTCSRRGVGRARWAAIRPPATAPTPMQAVRMRVGAGPPVEGVLGQQGQGHREVVGEDPDHGHGQQGVAQAGGAPDVAEAVPDLPLGPLHRPGRVQLGRPHHRQADDHGDVGGGVDEEADTQPDQRDDHAPDGRPDHPGGVHHHGVQAHGVGKVVAPHHLHDEGLAGRIVEDVDHSRAGRPAGRPATAGPCGSPPGRPAPGPAAHRRPGSGRAAVRLFIRSATSPPKGPNSSMGRNWRPTTIPRSTPLPVRWRTSHAWATVCIQVPETEMSWAVKYSR